jgi:hypothetical protein
MTELAWTHPIADMPSSSRHYSREATPQELDAIAASLGIIACHSLHAAYTIRALGGGRYKLTGTCKANVTQACVITLEPIDDRVTFDLDAEFVPDTSLAMTETDTEEVEVSTLPEIEPIENGGLDVGRVIFEAFAAGINPYPKKPDAAFAWDDPRVKDPKTHPFAALAQLKPKE